MSTIRGAAKLIRGKKQEADGKALGDVRLREAGRRLAGEGKAELKKSRTGH
ncbi:hypothetical protein ACWGRF_13900 [Streptomyces zhihengii]|uniref:CsbD family protein n=1 Tax=Streptomyces zhihengii TaxID=1818004 RepID=A0ABS2V237_9ACTN|nr:hypothetical protein [Streptomyces zhihengii]MBM9623900.1 hypothetical protein [Streptomyces zhihengii]